MLKGSLLGSNSVPAVIQSNAEMISGDSIYICKWLWDTYSSNRDMLDTCDTSIYAAYMWSEKLTTLFYDVMMDRKNSNRKNSVDTYRELMIQWASFGKEIQGPYFYGNTLSLVDISIFPFAYRMFILRLFHVYNREYLTLDDIDEICHSDMVKVVAWCEKCMTIPAFVSTLPPDATPDGFSAQLVDIYKIYFQGIGLKPVNYSPS